MTLRITPAADDDAERRAERLEGDRRGRGLKFLREYRAVVANLKRFPQMYPPVEDDVANLEVRNAILEHFRLRIVYVVREVEVVVISIEHTSSGSNRWHSRLTDDLYPEDSP